MYKFLKYETAMRYVDNNDDISKQYFVNKQGDRFYVMYPSCIKPEEYIAICLFENEAIEVCIALNMARNPCREIYV